jgi:hypothetical protein
MIFLYAGSTVFGNLPYRKLGGRNLVVLSNTRWPGGPKKGR